MAVSTFHSDSWTRMNDHDEAFSSEDEDEMSFNVNAPEFIPSFNVNAPEFIPSESSDDEGYGTAAEDLPRNFGEATRDFFIGDRGEDLSKVNPSCVPVEVNVSSKKTKKTKKTKKNLMPGLGDPIPRPGIRFFFFFLVFLIFFDDTLTSIGTRDGLTLLRSSPRSPMKKS